MTAAACPICGSAPDCCYTQCPNSPDYYSAEREMADSIAQDAMSDDEWKAAAAAQYKAVHGFCPFDSGPDPDDIPF